MGFITLTDRGWYQVSDDTTDNTTEEKAYGSDGAEGGALNIHCYSLSFKLETMLNTESQPNKKKDDSDTKRYEFGEVDKPGINMPTWVAKCVFKTDDVDDMKDYGRLLHMYKTKGYKRLGVSSATVANILEYCKYGEREKDGESTKTVSYVAVRIKSIEPKQMISSGKNKIDVTINMVETS